MLSHAVVLIGSFQPYVTDISMPISHFHQWQSKVFQGKVIMDIDSKNSMTWM